MVTRSFERARAEAAKAEAAVMAGEPLGLLHGLPIGIKDLSDTAGIRTTYGSELFADHVPESDERVVAAVRKAGAIVLGKTNTPEFGTGANTRNSVFGATRNPFDPARTSGGSSGGSAVALACGMVPLATGSDHGGSLRTPAAYLRRDRIPAFSGTGADRAAGNRVDSVAGRRTDGQDRRGRRPADGRHGRHRPARSPARLRRSRHVPETAGGRSVVAEGRGIGRSGLRPGR